MEDEIQQGRSRASNSTDLFSPLRVAFSRDELRDKLTEWMVAEFGIPRDLDEDARDRWHERCGLIYHFIMCHFPDNDGKLFGENAELTHPEPKL